MKKIMYGICLAACTSLLLWGCGGGGSETAAETAGETQEVMTEETANTAPEETAETLPAQEDTEADTESVQDAEMEESSETAATEALMEEDQETAAEETASDTGTVTAGGYSVTGYKAENVNADIEYPQIEGLADAEIQNQWNQMMKERMLAGADEYTADDSYQLGYEVTRQDEKILSILVQGYSMLAGAAHPSNFCMTFNFDLENMELTGLSQMADVEEISRRLMDWEGCTPIDLTETDVRDYLAMAFTDQSALAEALTAYDFASNDYPAGYSFYRGDQLTLCMEAPHALGDYVFIEIDV